MRARSTNRALIFLTLLASGGFTDGGAQGTSRRMNILLLFQQQAETPTMVSFAQRLSATVRVGVAAPVELYQESLDLDRFAGRERWGPLARYLGAKYRGLRIDVVVPVGGLAVQFATERLRVYLPDIPVVFTLANEPLVRVDALPANVTGLLRDRQSAFASTFAMARSLQPDAERVVVVGGNAPNDSLPFVQAVRAVTRRQDPLDVVELQGLAFDTLLRRLHSLPPRTIVLLADLRRDARGQVFDPWEIVPTLARASSAPMYAPARGWIGDGIVGGATAGPGLDAEARRTGQLIVRVLGRRPGDALPPVEMIRGSLVADWRQLRRWGLSERRLPSGTELLFHERPAWQRYKTAILVGFGLIAAQSLLIGSLLVERRRRKQAQLAVEDQTAYEQTIAELTTDGIRHASNETPRALEDALARVGRYAGAHTAVLIEYPDIPFRPPSRLAWSEQSGTTTGDVSITATPSPFPGSGSRLDIALVADGMPIGTLELYSADPARRWPERMVGRLDAAGELIAAAMARARAARAIRRGEELNQAVLASFSSPIAILDRNGTIIRVNDAWRQIAERTGVDPCRDGFLGENYLDECRRAEGRGSVDAHEVRKGIEAVLSHRAWPFRHEYRWSSPEERWYEMVVDRLDRVDGGAIVTHLDITDRRIAEREAEETRRQVTHMGRVAMVGELASAISHELRQPLAAIRANAEAGALILNQHPPEVTEAKEIFMDIVVDDVRASEIIDHIRTLLRKEEPAKAALSLNEICRQAVHLVQRDAALRSTRLELALEPRLPSVIGDPVQLQQVVLNLILNAIDAAATSNGEREVVVGTARRASEVEIFVRDTGRGLPPNVEKRLFESFFSTKAHGLGMGLAIARSIVERHHGQMRAENYAAGGAVFRVMLPLQNVGDGRGAGMASTAADAARSTQR